MSGACEWEEEQLRTKFKFMWEGSPLTTGHAHRYPCLNVSNRGQEFSLCSRFSSRTWLPMDSKSIHLRWSAMRYSALFPSFLRATGPSSACSCSSGIRKSVYSWNIRGNIREAQKQKSWSSHPHVQVASAPFRHPSGAPELRIPASSGYHRPHPQSECSFQSSCSFPGS